MLIPCILLVGKMAPNFSKGDMKVLDNKRKETLLSSKPDDKATGKTLGLSRSVPKLGKPTITEELFRYHITKKNGN